MGALFSVLPPRDNRLLRALPPDEASQITPLLEAVPMRARQVLHKQGDRITHVYFPRGAVASVTTEMADGNTIEIATIGNEGFVGLTTFLGEREAIEQTVVQVGGPDGLRMDTAAFTDALARLPAFHDLMRRYSVVFVRHSMQSVACNGLHDIEQRCCRWLLMTEDRLGSPRLPLTHEFLAVMLGVRRPSVTLALGQLQRAGLIDLRRGEIVVVKRESMEDASCECYMATRRDYARLLPECVAMEDPRSSTA